MDWHRSWPARIGGLLRRGKREREMDEELSFHLEMQAAELERRGMSREAARQAARRRFGGVEQVKEEYRRQGGVPWLESFAKDLAFGWRLLRKSPLVTAVALVSLSLGLGASGAIFNVIDSLMLARLPVAHPEQLVVLEVQRPNKVKGRFSQPAVRLLERGAGVFAGVAGFIPPSAMLVKAGAPAAGAAVTAAPEAPRAASTAAGGPAGAVPTASAGARGDQEGEWVQGQLVTGGFFPLLGVRALLGRTLGPEDDRAPGASPVAVLGYDYWRRRFAGDPGVLGRGLAVNGQPLTIVGVMPPGFFGVSVGDVPALYLPAAIQAPIHYSGNASIDGKADEQKPWMDQPHIAWLQLMARLRPAVSSRQAAAVIGVGLRQFEAANLEAGSVKDRREIAGERLRLAPGGRGVSELRSPDTSQPLAILMGAAGVLLLIACANTANLLLARGSARHKEIAVRLSQGAGRARLVRQLLTESLLLAVLAGACGLALARWGSRLLLRISAGGDGWPLDLSLGWRKLAFSTAVCLGTALLFGLAPALQATRLELAGALKEGARSTPGGGARTRLPLGKLLVVAEVGLSLVLLVGAGLCVRSLRNLSRVDPGYQRRDVLLVSIYPELLRLDPPRQAELARRIQERLAALPGVRSASLSFASPAAGSEWHTSIVVPGHSAGGGEEIQVGALPVTPRYFETLGIPLVQGRDFSSRDGAGAPEVAIVNEQMARAYFGGRSPLGQRFGRDDEHAREIEIVGVARDARLYALRSVAEPMMFRPAAQVPKRGLYAVEVRSAPGLAGALLLQVKQALLEVEPALALGSARTLEAHLERHLSRQRAVARLTAFFGLVALLLSSIGLYGVISYGVVRRRGEIGLRLALGAPRGQVLGLVLRETMQLAAVGVAVGLLATFGAARLAASWLYGLSATDPATMGAAILVMAAVASAAGYLPARRAAEVDPLTALRSE
jgi:predicted permease